ncbi:phosphodiester glycosidase family protein [Arachidicoccus ginsenosidivorans]|jgi:exopolysaccharide biosynthesis protein|uniref:Phosphodiester glycosidase family protein n=1 Tax=Arachidicoccus ginsenosidivorans TaxID=496057 RepID=A0A5B8VNU9_9BACT|nr:phosphodiester glycosidase family protein [Arachidicoccus ginsenosidivorans]QEC73089.1 phosphodiester glycosidase family protein [Arachidicoccus ginsenosidivorans]
MKRILFLITMFAGTVMVYGQKRQTSFPGTKLLLDSSWQITPRIQEREIRYLDSGGKKVVVQVIKARLKKNRLLLEAATPNNKDQFSRQVVPEEMQAESSPDREVLAGVNADFFNMKNGTPLGPVVKDRTVIKGTGRQMVAFVGVLKSGRIIMGDSLLFIKKASKLTEALGARPLLLKDGKLLAQDSSSLSKVHHPRTAFGLSGKQTVYLVTVDGRQPEFSNGISLTDLGILMRFLGAENAVNLDGGGSTTMIVKQPGTDQYKVRNSPSGKMLRPVANSWILVRKR